MSYNINTQEYTCDICGFTGKFDAHDEAQGDLWGCEECEDTFCSKCFTNKFGDSEFDRMLKENDKVLCPACWEKRRQEILSNSESPAYISREIVEDLLERAQIISDGENSGYCTEDVPILEIPVADVVPFAEYKKVLLESRALYASEKDARFMLSVITAALRGSIMCANEHAENTNGIIFLNRDELRQRMSQNIQELRKNYEDITDPDTVFDFVEHSLNKLIVDLPVNNVGPLDLETLLTIAYLEVTDR